MIIPSQRQARWVLLSECIDRWFGPLSEDDRYTQDELDAATERLGLPLPTALREWYCIAGRAQRIWSRQDLFLAPENLRVDQSVLIFFVENQSVVRWGIRAEEAQFDDPPVIVEDVDSDDVWHEENSSISEFALEMFHSVLKWSSPKAIWAGGAATPEAIEVVRRSFAPLPFPSWHWPAHPTCFFGDDQLVIEINGDDKYAYLYVSSLTREAFKSAERLLHDAGVTWEGWSEQ